MAMRSMGKTVKLDKRKSERLAKALSRSDRASLPKGGNLAYTASRGKRELGIEVDNA